MTLRTRLSPGRTYASTWKTQWTLLENFGVAPSTVQSRAVTRCLWSLFLCSSSSSQWSSTLVAFFTRSKRNVNSSYPNVWSLVPVLQTFKKIQTETYKIGTQHRIIRISGGRHSSVTTKRSRSDKSSAEKLEEADIRFNENFQLLFLSTLFFKELDLLISKHNCLFWRVFVTTTKDTRKILIL